MAVQLQMRRGTTAEWTAADPTLANGEWGLDTTTSEYYIGNGTTAWTGLTPASLPSTAFSVNEVDAVGDIIYGSADNTVNNLTVGANDYVLTADSSVSNVGIKWAAPAAAAAGSLTGATLVSGVTASSLTSVGTLTGLTMGGALTLADNLVNTATMKDYAETVYAGGNTSTAQTLALTNGNVQTWTMTGNCTFTMPSGSTLQAGSSFTLILTQDGTGSRTGAFTGVKWAGGTVPTLTITATTGIDILTFTTFNGGASPVWHGFLAGAAMA
jgi:hypothetical protein